MSTTGAPSDAAVVACLEEGLRDRGERAEVSSIDRTPYAYATSFPLEEVVAHLGDGRTLRLILKDLTWARLLGQARHTKPRFLYEPRRCIDAYRAILPGSGAGPAFYGAHVDDRGGRYWLLVEKVPGVELWQVGEFATWAAVARWLARFHRRFGGAGDELTRRTPHLLRYGPDLLSVWPSRALESAERRGLPAAPRETLARIASRYDVVVERLASVPPTFVHGELYPSNVLVDDSGPGVRPSAIDWEMAGVGPALLDLAALTSGWPEAEQAELVDAYLDELGPAPWGHTKEVSVLFNCCRLHYALQWLGWATDWSPPPEQARDWAAEAVDMAGRLGL